MFLFQSADHRYQFFADGYTFDTSGKPILTDPQEQTTEQIAAIVRLKRDQLIADTDYLVMSDYPITEDKMGLVKTYRQLLRDITKQSGFPINIDWPAMPE